MSLYLNIVTATVENGLAIVCASLPTFGPLLSRRWYSSLAMRARKLSGFSTKHDDSLAIERFDSSHHENHKSYHKYAKPDPTDSIYLSTAGAGMGTDRILREPDHLSSITTPRGTVTKNSSTVDSREYV